MSDLNRNDMRTWTEVLWKSLHSYREMTIPEGDEHYDQEWDDICTAMAWIEETLDCVAPEADAVLPETHTPYRCLVDSSLWLVSKVEEGTGVVHAHLHGGGWACAFTLTHWNRDFVLAGDSPFGQFRTSTVSFDDGPSYPCFLTNQLWNGWSIPYFTKAVALTIDVGDDSLWYDVGRDEIVISQGEEDCIRCPGLDIEVDGATVHVFQVADGWCWDEV